jgi:hypothetical protein|tara:strand:+ start:753 stop:1562 length:810 start_codon:yes stop_codon:yes gene_type:complete
MIGINYVGKMKERLANQMFQYAAVKGIAANRGYQFCVPPSKYKSDKDQWNEHQLFVPFNLESLSQLQVQFIDKDRPVVREESFEFDENLFNNCPDFVSLFGFFQSEKYFKHIRKDLLKDFTFIDEYLEPCKKMIKDVENPIALHIRRTDYAQYSHHPICDINYYKEALSRFDSDREVIIFSDDPEWCLQESTFDNDRFLVSETKNQYLDLCMMTLCSDFIIANSSFSWWGAWLATNKDKRVVAPSKWFGPPLSDSNNTKDLYCEGWEIV